MRIYVTTLVFIMLIPGMLCALNLANSSAFTITSHNETSIDLHYSIPSWSLQDTNRGASSARKVVIEDSPKLFIGEKETLPILTATIAIPNIGGFDLQISNATRRTIDINDLENSDLIEQSVRELNANSSLYPQNSITISEPSIVRDLRILTINVYPHQYDTKTKQLIVNDSMDIRLVFNRSAAINEISTVSPPSPAFEKIYRALVLNYDYLNWQRPDSAAAPVMLVIYGNNTDATYNAKIAEYILLKRQRGYKVYSASTSVAGTSTTAIKNYIQNAYNNWTDRPDYVVLIGDVSGNIALPTFYSSGTYGEGDYPYTFLAGSDNLGDVVIGRISVTSVDEFSRYVAKVMAMEKNISVQNADWLNRMLLVGDSASSGISTIYTNRYIRDVSEHVNPSYTYTELYGSSPSTSAMNTAINQGVSFFNYRGYINMSGWSPSSSLVNGTKLPHAVIITCNTGTFAGGTSTTESFVRLGTSATPSGAITAIGMATSATHTPMNNCLDVGIFHGIYPAGMRNMGESMLLGKLYLDSVYGASNPSQAVFFAQICNLIGDPTVPVYIGIPDTFSLTYSASINQGTEFYEVRVRNAANNPVENAIVTLITASGDQYISYSNEYGYAIFDLPITLTGSLSLMVSKDDFKPSVSTVSIVNTGTLVYDGQVIDDDILGNSNGNNNQIVNSGETIEFYFYAKNTTSSHITTTSANFSTDDPYVTIQSSRIGFASIAPGQSVLNSNPAIFSVAENCPHNHQIVFHATGTFSGNSWTMTIPVIVKKGSLELMSYNFIGAPNNIVNPGDRYYATYTLQNNEATTLNNVYGVLRSHDLLFAIPDSLSLFGNVGANSAVTNNLQPFQIYARGQTLPGMVIPLELYLYNNEGYSQSLSLTITIGETTLTDPLGQDQYGYFIFDDGDTGYDLCPTYSWIGIAPAEGGSGSALPLTDPGATNDEGDQVGAVSITTVSLPFPFKFYGVTYTTASISSNGFISFGSTQNSDWRNWRLPGPGGPNPMLAVFWDDLQLNTGSAVYTYYNASQNYYVVQWNNVISGYDRVTPQTFQAILYNPIHYPTQSGDGQIKLQYKIFNNIDEGSGDAHPHGNYATIGIKDHNGLVGLEYTFNNQYPVAAKPLSHQSALFISTKPPIPASTVLMVESVQVYDDNENGFLEPGETADLAIRLGNMGLNGTTNISAVLSSTSPYISVSSAASSYPSIGGLGYAYSNSYYSISVSPSCPSGYDATLNLSISSAAGNWTKQIVLRVNKPRVVLASWSVDDSNGNNNGILDPGETAYWILNLHNETVIDANDITVSLTENSPYLSLSVPNLMIDVIPAGKLLQKRISVTITGSCPVGTSIPINVAISSSSAEPWSEPSNLLIGLNNSFFDFEADNGGFEATNNPSPGWEWGTSTYSGAYSGTKVWGTVLNDNYGNNSTYELVSPSLSVGANSTMTFRHRYNIENNYDGAQVLISTNGGQSWIIIHPNGSYPSSSLPALGGPGYHGTLTSWTLATFDLGSYAGQSVRIKWLLKTDNSVVRQGWFIDDVNFSNTSGSVTTGRVTGLLYIDGTVSGSQDVFIDASDFICQVNPNGTYALDLPVGEYYIKAIAPGFASTSVPVSVLGNTVSSGINPQLTYLPMPSSLSWIVQNNNLSIRWNDVPAPDLIAYRVHAKHGTQDWQLSQSLLGTSYEATLDPGTFHLFKVTALYDGSESLPERIMEVNFLNPAQDIKPANPNSISIQRAASSTMISWEAVETDVHGSPINVWEYRIFGGSTPDFVPAPANYLGSSPDTEFVDTNPSQRRFYKVLAVIGMVGF